MPLPTLSVFRPLLYDMPNDYTRASFEAAYVFYTLYFVLQVWWRLSAICVQSECNLSAI